jgi:hypothetical protein
MNVLRLVHDMKGAQPAVVKSKGRGIAAIRLNFPTAMIFLRQSGVVGLKVREGHFSGEAPHPEGGSVAADAPSRARLQQHQVF